MAAPRIVVVGGGSQFSLGLCESLVDYGRDRLAGAEVVLLDPDEEQLLLVHRFASRLAADAGVDLRFAATTSREEAFPGADYLLTTFRPGTHAQLEEDETIPRRFGLQGNETVGVGGIFMACRVVPVLRELVADARRLCPQAWFVNYTNPTQFVADAILRLGHPRVISLCDGFLDVIDDLALLLGVAPEAIRIAVAGTNHAMWVVRFTVDGRDGYPLLRERLTALAPDELERLFAPPETTRLFGFEFPYAEIYTQFVRHHGFRYSLRLFELYGLLPGPRYYWRYLLDQDAVIAAQARGDYVTMAGFYTRHLKRRLFDEAEARLQRPPLELRTSRREGGGGHGDLAVRVIASMANDLGETFVVNVPNRGAVSNLPEAAVLELSAAVDREGAHPFAVGPLPPAIAALEAPLVASQELAVTAALSGSRDDLLRAIVAHPLVNSVAAAEGCMDALLEAQAAWLPQFRAAATSG